MKVGIRYKAIYSYEDEVSLAPHLLRLFPRTDLHLRVERARFATVQNATVQYRRDLYDNVVASCFFPGKVRTLPFELELDIHIEPKNPFGFLLASHALRLPFKYLPEEAIVLDPYLTSDDDVLLPRELTPTAPVPTVEAVVTLNRWIFENLTYERRDEGPAMHPAETLASGRGACRDFARLMVTIARKHGLAARLASGFLWEPPDLDPGQRRAESALHAWTEVYLPGAGWVALDPTNGVLCNEHFITTAVGRSIDDIAPVHGTYYGRQTVPSTLDGSLAISPV